jgi:hypothetical protein
MKTRTCDDDLCDAQTGDVDVPMSICFCRFDVGLMPKHDGRTAGTRAAQTNRVSIDHELMLGNITHLAAAPDGNR